MVVYTPDSHHSLYPAKMVRELDRITIEDKQVPGLELMQRAGKAAWDCLSGSWPRAKKIIVFCGAGNNAGDGYVLARYALENKKNVEIVTLTDPKKLKGDALTSADKYTSIHGSTQPLSTIDIIGADVIVDALLGTGLDRTVSGEYLKAIETINNATVPVLSIDIPSGLHADTGMPMGAAVHADITVSFIGQKQGLYTGQSNDYRGTVIFDDLNVPSDIYQSVTPSAELISVDFYHELLPRRSRLAHKGDYGHVLVVGGDFGYAGAVCMSGEAAARSGAGLVSIATRFEHAVSISASTPELMALGVEEGKELNRLFNRATVISIGPGLGQSDWSKSLFSQVIDTQLPLIVDADGLNLLAQNPVKRENWILTPHPGEAARLLESTTHEIQADRLSASRALQQKYNGVIVLKGPGTIIIGKSGRIFICADGNPGLATGGTGDVLSGVIAGLLAQGIGDEDAAAMGVCIHARAADLSAAMGGERGMMATDLMPFIRKLVNP